MEQKILGLPIVFFDGIGTCMVIRMCRVASETLGGEYEDETDTDDEPGAVFINQICDSP